MTIGGVNFMAVRFVELAAILRVLLRGELDFPRLPMDRWLAAFFFGTFTIYSARTQELNFYQLGVAIDGLFIYASVRSFLRTREDIALFLAGASLLLVPLALTMLIESLTGRNLFSLQGGVPETPILRNGSYRCQGSFRHAITAGTVGATFAPLFVPALYHRKLWGLVGLLSCLVIVATSHSSGPLMALFTAAAATAAWPLRKHTRALRRSLVLALILLHLAMGRPVWFIFDRLSGIFGGDGWHRSNLIDQFLRHTNEWLLAGMPPENTATWAATQMPWGGVDVTNYYISVSLAGGISALILFLCVIISAFKALGSNLARFRDAGDSAEELATWCIGSCLVTHVVNLSAVLYWDQSYVVWYTHLALVSSFCSLSLKDPLS